MSQTNLFIARHGQTEYNRTQRIQGRGIDEPLNELGRLQAKAVGKALQGIHIDAVFSSSLKRAVQTAVIATSAMNLPLQSYSSLDEMDFGLIEGHPMADITDEIELLHNRWKGGDTHFALEGGESPQAVLKRALSQIEKIVQEHRGQTIFMALHGRLIRILMAHWMGYGLADMHRIDHQNGALYHLCLKDEKAEVVYMNKTDHLSDIIPAGPQLSK